MGRRTRTAKGLGTRHDLNYFKRLSASQRWRGVLSVALPAVFLLWLLTSGVMGNQLPYSSGPVSKAHSVFAKQCSTCHSSMVNGVKTVGFKNNAIDDACLNCHRAPAHQASQTFTPACSSCHIEHRDTVQLTHTADSNCVRCHSNLTTKSGSPHFERTIFNFNTRHPEFLSVRKESRDPGTIAFNHYAHLHSDIAGLSGKVRLACDDCHRTPADSHRDWRFGENQKPDTGSREVEVPDVPRPSSGRAYMMPVTYAKNCMGCHRLQFDALSQVAVPHDRPEVVHAFVVEKLRKLTASDPGSLSRERYERRLPEMLVAPKPAIGRSALDMRIQDDEQLLWRKTCKLCHVVAFPNVPAGVWAGSSRGLPTVSPSNITKIWFPHSVFSHYSHQELSCESCHKAALTSQETSDVLLPGIKTCQECHRSSGASSGAENGCFECHQYHSWKEAVIGKPQHGAGIAALQQGSVKF